LPADGIHGRLAAERALLAKNDAQVCTGASLTLA
jgi:hypothetical protein